MLLFLVLIVIHEFGHFIAAKLFGVRVNEFAVGFGPTVFKKQGKETLYALRLVPFGGYCAMEGEDEESADERAFCNKSPFKRFVIVAAGAVFNIIFGLILMACIIAPQEQFVSTTVSSFYEEAVSNGEGGLMAGDKILKVNGRTVSTAYDLNYTFSNISGSTVEMTVERGGEKINLPAVPFKTEEAEGINYIQVDFYVEPIEKTVGTFISQTFRSTFSYVKIVLWSLFDLLTGKYGMSAVGGPVAVTQTLSQAAKMGLSSLLPMFCLITINLGVFNLLPVPALDGGRLLFILIEMIARKPVPRKYEGYVHAAGLVLLLGLIGVITINDIIRLFR